MRDYDPAIGRYVESDPVGMDGGINTYLYASAMPTALIDPLGLLSAQVRECVCMYMWGSNFQAQPA